MLQCVSIADDLTGANATGVLFRKMDYRTYTVMNSARLDPKILNGCECLMYPTDSRNIPAEIAYNRVANVTNLVKNPDIKIYSKRIDSTLRGNVGAETEAMLNSLGDDYIAVAASAFPESGRIIIGGYMLVNGIPLHRTEAAIDPKAPVDTSDVAAVFRKQCHYPVASIYMDDLMEGTEAVSHHMLELKQQGARIIVCDCVTQEDLDLIADALIQSGIKFVSVDPGPFTATLARKLVSVPEITTGKKILTVVGSVNAVARRQIEQFWLAQNPFKIEVKTSEFLENEERRQQEIDRVVREVEEHPNNELISIYGDGILPVNRLNLQDYADKMNIKVDDVSEFINNSFAEITESCCRQDPSIQGLYTSGGDITAAVCRKFQTAGLELLGEVLPLAAYGKILKGEFDGLQIITKGGMVGNDDAMNRCINYLKDKLQM